MIDTSEEQHENEWARSRTVERLRAKIDVVEDTKFVMIGGQSCGKLACGRSCIVRGAGFPFWKG